MSTFLLSHLLAAQASRHGARPALEVHGEATAYAALQEQARRLAATLAAHGVGHRDRVGICLPKELAAYVSIFAVLECGAAYVPLDPAAPAARVRSLIRDCGLRALITTGALAPSLLDEETAAGLSVVIHHGPLAAPVTGPAAVSWQLALAEDRPPPPNPAIETDLAYILYTSGSTGRPKGVMVSHRAALAFVRWAVSAFALDAEDRVAAVAALHFDLSVFDLFATVAAGATLLPLPAAAMLRPKQASAWIAERAISVWYSTPSTLVLLLEDGALATRAYPALGRVLFAGEVFPTKHLRRLRAALPAAALYNLYGPTETNVCTFWPVTALPDDSRQTIPIGRACANTEVAALGDHGRPVADGEEGELWVRGPTLMHGYWGDAEGSAAVLRARPEVTPGREPWYRTGDRVHRDRDGLFHFHGRRDHMVKVRGYRIELGEVEAALYAHPEIREAAALAVDGDGDGARGGAFLRAFVVPAAAPLSALQLKAFLGERLPAYMIPAEIVSVEALPKTSTGKIDRARLGPLAAAAAAR